MEEVVEPSSLPFLLKKKISPLMAAKEMNVGDQRGGKTFWSSGSDGRNSCLSGGVYID